MFSLCFSRKTAQTWRDDPEHNFAYLMAQQCVFQRQLDAVGYVFLSDVLCVLGFSETEIYDDRDERWLGWVAGDIIDFGINETLDELSFNAHDIFKDVRIK